MNWKNIQYFKEERMKKSALQVKYLKWKQADMRPIERIVVQLTEMSANSELKGQKSKLRSDYRVNEIREPEFNLVDIL